MLRELADRQTGMYFEEIANCSPQCSYRMLSWSLKPILTLSNNFLPFVLENLRLKIVPIMLKMNKDTSAKSEKGYLGLFWIYGNKFCLDFNHLFFSYFTFSVLSPWDQVAVFRMQSLYLN